MDKTKEIIISFSRKHLDLSAATVESNPIQRMDICLLLGVKRTDNVDRIKDLYNKCSQLLYMLLLRRVGMAQQDILHIFTSMIQSVLEYASPAWHTSLTQEQSDRQTSVYTSGVRIVYRNFSSSKTFTSGVKSLQSSFW